MRPFLKSICVVALSAAVVFVAREAQGFEYALGKIIVTDAGSGLSAVNNLTTATPFRINPLTLITVQPSVAAYVCVDTRLNIDAGSLLSDGGQGPWSQQRISPCRQSDGGSFGVLVAAGAAFPSSCGKADPLVMPDGGFTSCTVGCVPSSGVSVTCEVSQRQYNSSPPEF